MEQHYIGITRSSNYKNNKGARQFYLGSKYTRPMINKCCSQFFSGSNWMAKNRIADRLELKQWNNVLLKAQGYYSFLNKGLKEYSSTEKNIAMLPLCVVVFQFL